MHRFPKLYLIVNKLSDSLVSVGLRQGCSISPILFITFMDIISSCSQDDHFDDHKIMSALFADYAILTVSDLQLLLESFKAKCEAPGMKISVYKSEAMVLSWIRAYCFLQVGYEVLFQVQEFNYIEDLFMNEEKKKEWKVDNAAS